MERGEAGEGMAIKTFHPNRSPDPMSERGKGMWVQREDPRALGRALGWEGGSCVTLGKTPSWGLSFLFCSMGMVV